MLTYMHFSISIKLEVLHTCNPINFYNYSKRIHERSVMNKCREMQIILVQLYIKKLENQATNARCETEQLGCYSSGVTDERKASKVKNELKNKTHFCMETTSSEIQTITGTFRGHWRKTDPDVWLSYSVDSTVMFLHRGKGTQLQLQWRTR